MGGGCTCPKWTIGEPQIATVISELLGKASLDGITACGIIPIQPMAQPSSSASALWSIIHKGILTRGSGTYHFLPVAKSKQHWCVYICKLFKSWVHVFQCQIQKSSSKRRQTCAWQPAKVMPNASGCGCACLLEVTSHCYRGAWRCHHHIFSHAKYSPLALLVSCKEYIPPVWTDRQAMCLFCAMHRYKGSASRSNTRDPFTE
jgi:hypothetical protein